MREQVEIYSTKKGMMAIESPIKNRILQKLKERELTFEELIEVWQGSLHHVRTPQ
jgi:hypothetical protein